MARELGVTPQVVSNWKSRNQVPYKYVKRIREKIDGVEDKSKLNIPFVPLDSIIGNVEGRPNENSLDETTLISLVDTAIKSVRNNKLIFFLIPIIFGVFIFIKATYIEAPYYISTGKILPQGEDGIGSKLSGLMSTFGVPVQSSSTNINDSQLFPDIIRSRDFNISLLNRPFYLTSKGSGQPLIKILTGRVPSTPNDSLRLIASGLYRLKKMINIIPNKVNSVITISVIAGKPKLASDLAMAVIDELDIFQRRFKTEKIKEKRIFIDSRMIEVKSDLVKVEENLKIFRQQNKNRKSPALMLEEERLEREVTVQTEIYITLMQESELAQIEEVENTKMIVILDSPMTPFSKSNPLLSRRLILVIFFGFFVSSAVIIMKEWLSQNWDLTFKPLFEKK